LLDLILESAEVLVFMFGEIFHFYPRNSDKSRIRSRMDRRVWSGIVLLVLIQIQGFSLSEDPHGHGFRAR